MIHHQETRGKLMTVDDINVEEVKKVTELIVREENLSPALKASLEVLTLHVSILINRLGLKRGYCQTGIAGENPLLT